MLKAFFVALGWIFAAMGAHNLVVHLTGNEDAAVWAALAAAALVLSVTFVGVSVYRKLDDVLLQLNRTLDEG